MVLDALNAGKTLRIKNKRREFAMVCHVRHFVEHDGTWDSWKTLHEIISEFI